MKILLTTLHSRYSHASLALPSLAAICRQLEGVTPVIREYTVHEPGHQLLQRLAAEKAEVVMFSCYIWNVEQTLRLAADLKKIRPQTYLVLGGPEVSYGAFELLHRHQAIDCIVRGEGEETCRELIETLRLGHVPGQIAGITFRDGDDIVAGPGRPGLEDLDRLPSPLALGLVDLDKPLVYHETSRGCPFSCAFCLSSVERGVRSYSMARIRSDLQLLMAKPAQTIKLVDRTFNYDAERANQIWAFILEHNRGSRFHFEIAADLLTDANIRLLQQVPAGMFRFEVGVQSVATETLQRIGRNSDLPKLFANVERLRSETGVVLHLDLVAGLPGEDYAGFTGSLQRLLSAAPHHIQVEPLKVLKGTAMRGIARNEHYLFSDAPPYRVLQSPWLSFADICRIETIGRLLDLVFNSGRFSTTLACLAKLLPLARVFDLMARYWTEHDAEATPSQNVLFETVWQFGAATLPEGELPGFEEALSYDFCLADYPVGAKIPPFFAGTGEGLSRSPNERSAAELARSLGIGPGFKVRSFSRSFARDYRHPLWPEGEIALTFLYVSAQGQGQSVRVLDRQ